MCFPPGVLQFELGIQTWNTEVQQLISRRQDNAAAEENLRWLRAHTNAHLHVDLIAGLPGEDVASFARGFDRLVALHPHEIQLGILKRLRGAPIARHTDAFALRFNPEPPYNVLATDRIDFATMQRIARFASYWERIANSGRFARTLPLTLGAAPFANFLALSDWLYEKIGRMHSIANERLHELLYRWLSEESGIAPQVAAGALAADFLASGAHGSLSFADTGHAAPPARAGALSRRQRRHLRAFL